MTLGITGASGRVGRAALDAALDRNAANQIVATTRNPEALSEYRDQGVSVRFADFDQADSLESAFAGVDKLLIVSATNATGKRGDEHENAVNAARSVGVSRLVFTSMPNVDRADHPSGLSAQEYRAAEVAIEASGMDHLVLRVSPYTELNAVERMLTAVATGTLKMNTGNGRAAFISRQDVGRATAAALTSDLSGIVDLTGPELRDFADVTRAVSELLGRPIVYDSIDDESYHELLLAAGDSQLLADAVAGLGRAIRSGYFEVLTDTAKQLLGRPPLSMEQVLADNEAELRRAIPAGA
jgi:NAD(P)H dehydrogenase (quinone)